MAFQSLCPIMQCRDLAETQKLYAFIGFETEGVWDEYGYMIMRSGGAEIHFTERRDLEPKANNSAAYLRLEDVDGISERLATLGWPIDDESIPRFGPVVDTPWGMRETAWVDPSGNGFRAGAFADG